MKHRASLAILSLSLLTAGCAGTPLRPDTSNLETEIARLRAQVVELQRQAAMDEVEIARLRQQLGEKAGRPAPVRPSTPATTTQQPSRQATATPPPRPAPQEPARQPVATPPRTTAPARPTPPPPVVEEREAPVVEEEIEEADIDVPESPPTPVKPQTRPATPPPPPPAAGDTGEVLAPASQALYDRGYTLYHQGHFVDAETSFQRFLQGNPKSELADNASYWIGECRYARGDLRGALAAFRETVSRFPEGNKLPDALLKIGQCLEALDDVDGARAAYAEVSKRFPGSAAAQVADERRQSLP